MVKKKTNTLVWWILLGIIIIFFFLPQTGFLGSVITICDNFEPEDISGFPNATTVTSTTFIIGNDSMTFPTFYYEGLTIINLGIEINCKEIYGLISGTENKYSNHKYKTSDIDNNIYWCNKAETLLLYTESITTMINYYSEYEICRTQEYSGIAYEKSETICEEKFGVWDEETELCICPDNTILKINDVCEVPVTREEPTTSQTITTEEDLPSEEKTFTDSRNISYIVGILAIIAIGYLIYSLAFKKKKRGR